MRIKLPRRSVHSLLGDSRGDTLVEVVFALGILSAVLASAFGLADLAFRVGQTAKERTQASNFIQEQAEALHNTRDNFQRNAGWVGFKGQVDPYVSVPPSCGVPPCPGQNVFHLEQSGGNWAVRPANYTPLIDGNPSVFTISDVVYRDSINPANKYHFSITATWRNNGQGPLNNVSVDMILVNTDGITPLCAVGGVSC